MWTFYISLKTVQAIETTFHSHSTSYYGTMCAIRSKPYSWDLRKKAKDSSKNTKKNIFGLFIFPQKLCRLLKRLFTVIHIILGLHVCSYIKTVWLGSEKQMPKVVKNTKRPLLDFLFSLQNCAGD